MLKTVAFFGTCAARATLVLVSPRISTPYQLARIRAEFPAGAANLVQLRFFVAPDDYAPTSGAPSGVSVLADYGQVDYVAGDDDIKDLSQEVDIAEAGSFLKVYADNTDYYDHDVDVQMTIDLAG